MRILHTSDWHLGRSLHGADLGSAQEAFLDHLVELVASESIDVVAIAGDIYDRAIPPVQSMRLLEDGLARLRGAGAEIVAISGNHDSATRLGFGAALMAAGGFHIRTSPAAIATPSVIGDVAFYCLPFLEPDAVRTALPGHPDGTNDELGRTHDDVIERAMACVRADIAAHGRQRAVVLAHGWVTGGAPSESERDVSVGNAGHISKAHFDGIDYVALGHLHGQQSLDDHLRYSGSPLAYSFSEANHTKGSWIVTLEKSGVTSVERADAPVHRKLVVLTGTVDDLLTNSAHAHAESCYVSAVATDETRPVEPMERLRTRFPHVLAFKWDRAETDADRASFTERIAGRSDLDLTLDFVKFVRNDASDAERVLLNQAFDHLRTSEVSE